MQATGSQAIIPKARGMYAKRILPAEYEELMRRRTVPEVAAVLRRHPFFGGSLATLSAEEPRREQLEELLEVDLYQKYRALARYDFSGSDFSRCFVVAAEVHEVLQAVRALHYNEPDWYLHHLPAYEADDLRVDLYAMGRAQSFAALVEALRGTPYNKVLQPYAVPPGPGPGEYPYLEADMLRSQYAQQLHLVDTGLSGNDRKEVRGLFLQGAEIHNLRVILRCKTYFPGAFPPEKLRRLLLPYSSRYSRQHITQLVEAPNEESLRALYVRFGMEGYSGPVSTSRLDATGGQMLYHTAKRLLRMTTSPLAALAAFLQLAELEHRNIINVVEGVRYGLPPEQIRGLLRL